MIFLLLNHGGNLNILNNYGESPVAFASKEIIEKMDLQQAIATVKDPSRISSPFDNNKLLYRQERKLEPFNDIQFAVDFDFSNFSTS